MNIMEEIGENRLILIHFLYNGNGEPTDLYKELAKKWKLDNGYTNALGTECIFLLCRLEEI